MPLPGEEMQQRQGQPEQQGGLLQKQPSNPPSAKPTPPTPQPLPPHPNSQKHHGQVQGQPGPGAACAEAVGIAKIRSCVGTTDALRACLQDQSKDACSCVRHAEGSKACLAECFPTVEKSLCGSAADVQAKTAPSQQCVEEEAAATASRCFGANATMLACLRSDDGGGSPCACFANYPAACLGHCYQVVQQSICDPTACTEEDAAVSARRCFSQNATMLACLRNDAKTPCMCFDHYPTTCLGSCYNTVGLSVCPNSGSTGGNAGGKTGTETSKDGSAADAGESSSGRASLDGLALALAAVNPSDSSAVFHSKLQLAGMAYYAALRTLPPKQFQQAVIFIGMHPHSEHLAYLAKNY